jgi:hypothetical protein
LFRVRRWSRRFIDGWLTSVNKTLNLALSPEISVDGTDE